MMINVSLIENKVISNGKKKEIEKRKIQIKKPKSLKDFYNFLMDEFKTQKKNFIRIYSMDWDGEANEIKEDLDFQDEDNIAFKVIYDEDNPNMNNEEEEEEKSDSKSEKDIQNEKKDKNKNENENKNDESFESINEDELMNILDTELKYEKKEDNAFDSKIFCDNFLNEFINKQSQFINNTKLKIDKKIENIMTEQSEFFSDIKNIPQIQESMCKITKNFIENSKINFSNDNKNNIEEKKEIKLNSITDTEEEKKQSNSKYDIKFLNNKIFLEKNAKEAKWINIEDIQFQNIGKETFTNEDVLYFFKEENSSEDYYFPRIQKDVKQDISLEDDLKPLNISQKFTLTIRNEEPLIGNTYNFNIIVKSDKKEIKMKNNLQIIIKIIDENDSDDVKIKKELEKIKKEEMERLNKEKLIRERLERMEKEKLEREEIERKKREEKEKLEREEIERKQREEKEKLEREEIERKQREEKEKLEREEKEKKQREEKERLEKEEKEKKQREEKEKLEKEEKEKLENERNRDNNEDENEGIENGGNINNNEDENKGQDMSREELAQKIYDELEEQLYISSFKPEEEIKEQILKLGCDRDKVQKWLDEIM